MNISIRKKAEEEIYKCSQKISRLEAKYKVNYNELTKNVRSKLISKYSVLIPRINKSNKDKTNVVIEPNVEMLRKKLDLGDWENFDEMVSKIQNHNKEDANVVDNLYYQGGMYSNSAYFGFQALDRFTQLPDKRYNFPCKYSYVDNIFEAISESGSTIPNRADIHIEKDSLFIEFWKHQFIFSDSKGEVQYWKKNRIDRISKRKLSDFIDVQFPLKAVACSSTHFYFAQQEKDDIIRIVIYRDTLLGRNQKVSIKTIKTYNKIESIVGVSKKFYVHTSSGMIHVNLKKNSIDIDNEGMGGVFALGPFRAAENEYISSKIREFVEDQDRRIVMISQTKYPKQKKYTQIIGKQYPEDSSLFALIEISNRFLQCATKAIEKIDEFSEIKDEFELSLAEKPVEYIPLIISILERIILSTYPLDIRIFVSNALVRTLIINLIALSSRENQNLDAFLVKRVQRILINLPECTPSKETLMMFVSHIFADVYTSSRFIQKVFGKFNGIKEIEKINGPQSVFLVNEDSLSEINEAEQVSFILKQLINFVGIVNEFDVDEPLVPFIRAFVEVFKNNIFKKNEARNLIEHLSKALISINLKPHISMEIINGMKQYIQKIITTIFRCRVKEADDVFCTDFPIEREYITFRRDVISYEKVILHTIANGTIQNYSSLLSTRDGYLTINDTDGDVIHVNLKNEVIKNEPSKDDEEANIFMYVIGKCTMSCIESIMENQFEKDNRFMLEYTGGILPTSFRELTSNEPSKKVGRYCSAEIFNQSEFISEIIRGAPFVDQISKSIRTIVKPNEEMKLAMRHTFAAALVHTGLVRSAHSFSIRYSNEIPQNLKTIMRECVKLYPVLARAKQSTIVSGSLKHRYNDFLEEISKKSDCLILQEPSKKPFNEALSETIRFIGSNLPMNEVHILIDIKRERELIRENGICFLEKVLSFNIRKGLKESFLQAIENSDYITDFESLIESSSILHSIRLFGNANLETAMIQIQNEEHQNFWWELIQKNVNTREEKLVHFVLIEAEKGNKKAQNIVIDNFSVFNSIVAIPKAIRSLYDLQIMIKYAERDCEIILKYGFVPDYIIQKMSSYILLEEDDQEFFYIQWYEEIVKFLNHTDLILKYKEAAWKELTNGKSEYLLGAFWLISQFETYFLSPEEAEIICTIFNQITEDEKVLTRYSAVKLKLSIDVLSVCLKSESNFTQFRAYCDLKKLFDVLRTIREDYLCNITHSPVFPNKSWIALRGGSAEENKIQSVSDDVCVFIGPSMNKPNENEYHSFNIEGETKSAEFGYITAEGKIFGRDCSSKGTFANNRHHCWRSTSIDIYAGSEFAILDDCKLDIKSSFPILPFIVTFNEKTEITAKISQKKRDATCPDYCEGQRYDPCIPICVGSKVIIKEDSRQAIVLETREGNDTIDVVAIGNGLQPKAVTVSASNCERVPESMQIVVNRFLKIMGYDCNDLDKDKIQINSIRTYAKKILFDRIIEASVSIELPLIIEELSIFNRMRNVSEHPDEIKEFINLYGRHINMYDSFIIEAKAILYSTVFLVLLDNINLNLKALLSLQEFNFKVNQKILKQYRKELTIEQLSLIFNKEWTFDWYVIMQEKIEDAIKEGNFANVIECITSEICDYTRIISFAPSFNYKKLFILGFIDKEEYAPNCSLAINNEEYNKDLINEEIANLYETLTKFESLVSTEIEEACCKVYEEESFEPKWENDDVEKAFDLRKSMLFDRDKNLIHTFFPTTPIEDIVETIINNLPYLPTVYFDFNRFSALLYEKTNGKEGKSMIQQLIEQKNKLLKIGCEKFSFSFIGEGSIDAGGPSREALTMFSHEILKFCDYTDDGYSLRLDAPLYVAEATGIVCALALCKSNTIPLVLDDAVWKAIVSSEIPSDPIMASIHKGFGQFLFDPYRGIFNWKSIRDGLNGLANISGAELIPLIEDIDCCLEFKEVVESFDPVDVRRLLRFVTGSETVRPDKLAFRISVYDRDSKTPPENAFIPIAHTCFRSLDVYRTGDASIMEKKLRLAMDAILISDNRENLNDAFGLM